MGRFEYRVTGDVINIAAGRDPDPADLRSQCVAQVIAVQIQRRDHVEIFRPHQYLLQRDVGDRVFDHNAAARFAHWNFAPRPVVDLFRAEIIFRNIVAPIAKRTLGELHDVALVHERDALALIENRVTDRAVDQAHAAGATHRF